MARELEAAAAAAPDGRVLAEAELVAVRAGRELTRKALEAALQGQAAEAEKRGHPAACGCGQRRYAKGKAARQALTAAGRVTLRASTSAAHAAATPATRSTAGSAWTACSAPAPTASPAWPPPVGRSTSRPTGWRRAIAPKLADIGEKA